MVELAVTMGLLRSELFALRWSDVNFSGLEVLIRRSIYLGKIGDCKTETSRRPLPLDERVAADLWLWKETSKRCSPEDWIFASPHRNGADPYWPETVPCKGYPTGRITAGIYKKVGWHTHLLLNE
jgi:integrase